MIENIIKDIANKELSSLLKIVDNGYLKKKEFIINCSDLEDYNLNDIRDSEKFDTSDKSNKELFLELEKLTGSVLYFFEITSDFNPTEIVNSIKKYSSQPDSKKTPAIKKKYSDTNILYVGKVKRNFWGRVIQHLGYYKVKGTQGLQLFYWAKELKLELKLTALQFDSDAENLVPMFEKKLAEIINPIIGKHK